MFAPARLSTLLLVCCLTTGFLPGQSIFDSWCARGDTVVFRLDTEFRQLTRNRHKKAYQPLRAEVDGRTFTGRIRSRGHIRLEVCHLPSLKVKLKKDELRRAGYSKLNDLKFVLPCTDDRRGYGYLRRERLAYQIYAALSPYHHRTVPVRIAIDADTLRGFLVETEEQLSARYGAAIVENKSLSTQALDRQTYLDLCLFNYLILNTDWGIFNQHNVEVIAPEGEKRVIPIPYDFDYSGWVGTSYAVPDERTEITSIYEPKFLGRHVTEAELLEAAARWIPLSDRLHRLIEDHPGLRRGERRRLIKRLDEFYGKIGNRKSLLSLAKD